MKPNGQVWGCCICGMPTSTLHEIFYGHGVRVEYGIKYNLQVPLCPRHHVQAHNTKEKNQRDFCRFMGLDYQEAKLNINIRNKKYFDSICFQLKERLDDLEEKTLCY